MKISLLRSGHVQIYIYIASKTEKEKERKKLVKGPFKL